MACTHPLPLPRWVARIAVCAVVDVVPHVLVFRVHPGLLMRMAVQATERRVVRGIRVAVRARCPLARVCAAVDGESVIESRSAPRRRGVAGGASCGEACRRVVGVGRCRVVLFVAGITIHRRASELPADVATCALDADMRAGQGESRARMVKEGRYPRRRRMAHGAFLRESSRYVAGIARVVEVREVARNTCRAQAREFAADMAARAGHVDMSAGQGERRSRMVEFRAGPLRRRMAERAILGEACTRVVGGGRAVVIDQVAGGAILRGARIPSVDMTLLAGSIDVGTRQRELGQRIVVEFCTAPSDGAVARGAGSREAGVHMVRVGRAIEVGDVAGGAVFRRPGIAAIDVALLAGRVNVSAGQRELRLGVIELCPAPRRSGMARNTSGREAGGHVVGVGRRLKSAMWQDAQSFGVPVNRPFAWHCWQVALRCAPVSGNCVNAWSNFAPLQEAVL